MIRVADEERAIFGDSDIYSHDPKLLHVLEQVLPDSSQVVPVQGPRTNTYENKTQRTDSRRSNSLISYVDHCGFKGALQFIAGIP